MIHLDPQWRDILRRAWSVRLMLIAGMLSAAEAVLPYFSDALDRRVFSLVFAALTFAALIARLVAQRGLDG